MPRKKDHSRSASGRRAKQHGNAFERIVYHLIRDAWKLDEKECFRTPLSGGHRSLNASDILFGDGVFDTGDRPLFIECKYRTVRQWSFDYLFKGPFQETADSWFPIKVLEETRTKCPEGHAPLAVMGRPLFPVFAVFKFDDYKDEALLFDQVFSLGYYGMCPLPIFLKAYAHTQHGLSTRLGVQWVDVKGIAKFNVERERERLKALAKDMGVQVITTREELEAAEQASPAPLPFPPRKEN